MLKRPPCPICRYRKPSLHRVSKAGRQNYKCPVCKSYFSEQSGTIFKFCRLPQWQRDIMLAAIKHNPRVTAVKLAELAGVQYKTAWSFKRRVVEGPKAIRGYWQGRNRVGKHRTRNECAGIS